MQVNAYIVSVTRIENNAGLFCYVCMIGRAIRFVNDSILMIEFHMTQKSR